MRLRTLLILALIISAAALHAQSATDWDDFVAGIYDEMDEDEESAQAVILELEELRQHPIDLNTATESELHQLPFLSDSQVKDILFYRERNGLFISLGELMLIPGIDFSTRRRLQLFCTVTPVSPTASSSPTLPGLLRRSRHELTVRSDFPFYTRDGYRSKPDSILALSPNKVYLGNNNYHSLRYSLTSMNRLYAGLQIEKDGGEDEFDYLSAYLQYKHHQGLVRNIIIGDYHVGFAQGLVVNTSLSFGKLAMQGSPSGTSRGFTPHSSTTEAGYFRGIALTVKPHRAITLSAFFSHNPIDGTLRTDTARCLSSLKTDGLHRTPLERSKRHNLNETALGGNATFTARRWTAAITAMHSHLTLALMPPCDTPSTLYRRYDPSGTDFTNISIAYGYSGTTLTIQGETAAAAGGGIATLLTARCHISPTADITLTPRYYTRDYTSLHARSFGENSRVQNESGLCLAVTGEPLPRVQVTAYADWFRFPWLKYQVSASSCGFDLFGQADYQPTERTAWQLRYRIKTRQKDVKISKTDTPLYYYTSQNIRLQHTRTLTPNFDLTSVATLTMAFRPTTGNAVGYGLTGTIRWKSGDPWNTGNHMNTESHMNTENHMNTGSHRKTGNRGKTQAGLTLAYFHTADYDTRIHAYEPALPYAMGMTAYAYHGIRAALLLSVPVVPRLLNDLTACARLSGTRYFDRSTIGTAQELIDKSYKADLQLLLRYKF